MPRGGIQRCNRRGWVGPAAAFCALCAVGCSPNMVRSTAPAVAEGRASSAPSWLPPYTAAQLKLLVPVDQPVQVPATRTYPDLKRFGYANNRPLQDLRESV